MSFSYAYTWDYYPLFVSKQLSAADSISRNFVVTIYPYWFKQITLEWSIPVDWGGCRFNIYKSQTEDGPFDKLNQTPLDLGSNFYKDTTTQDTSKINRSWYIIEAILSSGKRIQSEPQTWGNQRLPFVEIRAQEIQRRNWILLNKFVGSETYVFRRRTYGKRCSNCWSFELEKCIIDKCPVCMGTSFEGGYFPPVKTLVQYDPDPNQKVLTYFGVWESNDVFAWTIAFPELKQHDLVYRLPDSALFYVSERHETTLQSVTVRQMFKVTQLDREAPEFQALLDNKIIPLIYQN